MNTILEITSLHLNCTVTMTNMIKHVTLMGERQWHWRQYVVTFLCVHFFDLPLLRSIFLVNMIHGVGWVFLWRTHSDRSFFAVGGVLVGHGHFNVLARNAPNVCWICPCLQGKHKQNLLCSILGGLFRKINLIKWVDSSMKINKMAALHFATETVL